ncbi:proteasome assembly chaperone family protein [Candidatus Woesearchaeota archaeon]|nr:proteasome assembly chaperone family protein [Candidatus Woesearchaeota archaeon]
MEIVLTKKPKSPVIIEGFPGFGLIGTIVTEYLIDHLETESIGTIFSEEIPPMVAVHKGRVVQPIEIFYNKKYNLVLLHVVTNPAGLEWEFGETVMKLAKMLQTKEIISVEGVGSSNMEEEPRTFYYSNRETKKKEFEKMKIEELKEGVIMGVTGIVLLKAKNQEQPMSCVFAETHSAMPDSKAAASVIKVLDKYLGLKIDPLPLEQEAEKFEGKLKALVEKSQEASEIQKKKQLSYMG